MGWELGNPIEMEENTMIFGNATVIVSAGAVGVSAICALLTFLFSRKFSRHDMVDILKIEILRVVSSVQGRNLWMQMVTLSKEYEGGGIGPRADRIAEFLGSKYKRKKWLWLIPVALEELKRENYGSLLGL